MGRKIADEEQLPNLNHLPYMDWANWITELNKFKYGIHLMRTHAAGTFALNCAYLGIPCIGYKGLDTQEVCHPDTTIEIGDLESAVKLAHRLKDDDKFYRTCSLRAKDMYNNHFSEEKFVNTMKNLYI